MKARTLKEVVEHIYAHTRIEGGCRVATWRRKLPTDYWYASFQGRSYPAHRLVALHHLGPCPKGLQTRHLCGRGLQGCVTASHLAYGTAAENAADRIRHRRINREEESR